MKLAGIVYNAKNGIPLFLMNRTKILSLKDFQDFFDSVHFLLL
jgi:hypothetical protein